MIQQVKISKSKNLGQTGGIRAHTKPMKARIQAKSRAEHTCPKICQQSLKHPGKLLKVGFKLKKIASIHFVDRL